MGAEKFRQGGGLIYLLLGLPCFFPLKGELSFPKPDFLLVFEPNLLLALSLNVSEVFSLLKFIPNS